MKTYVKALAGIGIFALSACGGASTGAGGGEFFEIAAGPTPPTYDVKTGVLSRNGEAIAKLDDRIVAERANASVTNGLVPTVFQARVEGDNVFAVSFEDEAGEYGSLLGRQFAPNLASLPSSGSAVYNGSYAGISTRVAERGTAVEPVFSAAVTGEVDLRIDFNSNRINGAITERTTLTRNGTEFFVPIDATPVTLPQAQISNDGRFETNSTGGRFYFAQNSPSVTFATSVGAVSGLIGGDPTGGLEIAGTLELTHTRSDGNVYEERGVFVAD